MISGNWCCGFLLLSAVYRKERQTGHGSLLPVRDRHESGGRHLKPPRPNAAPHQRDPRGGRPGGARAQQEAVQAGGGDGGGQKVLLQVRLQAHRRRHHRHLRQGRVPFHVRRGECDLLGGVHHVKRCRSEL